MNDRRMQTSSINNKWHHSCGNSSGRACIVTGNNTLRAGVSPCSLCAGCVRCSRACAIRVLSAKAPCSMSHHCRSAAAASLLSPLFTLLLASAVETTRLRARRSRSGAFLAIVHAPAQTGILLAFCAGERPASCCCLLAARCGPRWLALACAGAGTGSGSYAW